LKYHTNIKLEILNNSTIKLKNITKYLVLLSKMYSDISLIFGTIILKVMNILENENTRKILSILGNFILIVFITSFLHWSLIRFYSQNCIDLSWFGMFTNIINLGSPFCQFINYIQFEISKHYIYIWTSAGLGLIAYFIGNNDK